MPEPVTVKPAADKPQPVAPFDAVKPDPLMLAEPWALPVMAEPDTVAMEVFGEIKLPPLKPLGAEAVVVWPTLMKEEDNDTVPEGQLAGGHVQGRHLLSR